MVCINSVMHIMSREVIKPQRRQHSAAFKSELVARTLEPGASVSAIALKNGLNTNLLFAWRRNHLRALARQAGAGAARPAEAIMLPVHIASPGATPQPEPAQPSQGAASTIEIDVGGACVRVRGAVDEASLRCVLRVLRGLDS